MPSHYHHRRRVHFQDTDSAGIIHFSNYFRYMEEAETEFLFLCGKEAGVDAGDEFFIAPRVTADAEFLKPVRFGDMLDVHLGVSHIGQSSISYSFRFEHNGELVARGNVKAVCVSRDPSGGYRSTPIPAALKGVLSVSEQ